MRVACTFRTGLLLLALAAVPACGEGEAVREAATVAPHATERSEPVLSPAEAAEPLPAKTTDASPDGPPAEPASEETPDVVVERDPLAFTGRLIVSYRDRLYELVPGPVREAERRPIGRLCRECGDQVAAVSPDGRLLVFSTGRQTRLYDLRTGRTRPILQRPSSCLGWAPDSSKFAYVQEHLYVADRAGGSDLVYQAPSADYLFFTGEGSVGESRRMYGTVGCVVWMGANRLVFDRFSGAMPRSLGEDTDEFGRRYFDELEPNGTSIATLDGGPRLEHAAGRLRVTAACSGGRFVLLRNDALLAPSARGVAEIEPRRLLRRRGVLATGFLPGSCRPYAVTVDGFKLLDPRGGKARATYDVDAGETGPQGGRRWQGIWAGDPEALVVAVVDFDTGSSFDPVVGSGTLSEECPCSVALLDLETGDVQVVSRFGGSPGDSEIPRVLGWLPE